MHEDDIFGKVTLSRAWRGVVGENRGRQWKTWRSHLWKRTEKKLQAVRSSARISLKQYNPVVAKNMQGRLKRDEEDWGFKALYVRTRQKITKSNESVCSFVTAAR